MFPQECAYYFAKNKLNIQTLNWVWLTLIFYATSCWSFCGKLFLFFFCDPSSVFVLRRIILVSITLWTQMRDIDRDTRNRLKEDLLSLLSQGMMVEGWFLADGWMLAGSGVRCWQASGTGDLRSRRKKGGNKRQQEKTLSHWDAQ